MTKIQVKTACKLLEAAFECRLHGGKQRRISAPQLAAVQMLEQLPGAGQITVEQHRVQAASRKPVDIVLEQHGILIEVDGAQHALSSTGFGQQAGEQFRRDREVDTAVLAGGQRLVRLHHQDAAHWGKHVQAAIRHVHQQPNSSFVYYSASYPQHSRV